MVFYCIDALKFEFNYESIKYIIYLIIWDRCLALIIPCFLFD